MRHSLFRKILPQLILLHLLPCFLMAQQKYELSINFQNKADSLQLAQLVDLKYTCPNQTQCQQTLLDWVNKVKAKGYLSASFDSVQSDSVKTSALFYLGSRFNWLNLDVSGVPKNILAQIGYRNKSFSGKTLNPVALQKLQAKLLRYAENHGYPFASVSLGNITWQDTLLQASLLFEKGKFIRLDSLVIIGDAKINNTYLQNYLGLKKGQPYNESLIAQIPNRIKELPFLQDAGLPKVQFLDTRAKVNLLLKRKKASRFNVVLGILPKPQTPSASGATRQKIQIIGDGQLNLANALGMGERLDIDFKSYVSKRRELKIKVEYPYLPLLPLGADARFELFIADTSFRDVKTYLGLQYAGKGNNYVKAFIDSKKSVLLSVDSLKLTTAARLPDVLDVKNTLYGIEYNREQLDYRLNPRKGYVLNLIAAAGTKKVVPNLAVIAVGENLEIDFKSQYDSLNQNRLQYRLMLKAEKYWGIAQRSTIKTSLNGAYLGNKQLLQNELYRIGGNRLLRGFDEESVWASAYAVATVEYRFLLSPNSNFFLFFDGAHLQNKSRGSNTTDYPIGFGVGTNLETKAGIFGLMYALGTQQGNPINFRQGKIHFGYVAYF